MYSFYKVQSLLPPHMEANSHMWFEFELEVDVMTVLEEQGTFRTEVTSSEIKM